jgi:hypothetical protein
MYQREFTYGYAGGKSSRFGPKVVIKITEENAPVTLAYNHLRNLLQKKTIDKKDIPAALGLVSSSQQLHHMNLPVLAEVLVYIDRQGLNIVRGEERALAQFSYAKITTHLNNLLEKTFREEKPTEETKTVLRERMAVQFYRYLLYVIDLWRKSQEEAAKLKDLQPIDAPVTHDVIYG